MTENDLIEAGVLEFDADSTPYIVHKNGKLPEITDAMLYYLGKADHLEIFTRAGGLAKIYQTLTPDSEEGVHRPKGAILIHPMKAAHLREQFGRVIQHKRWDSRQKKLVPIDCPRQPIDALLERGHWEYLRPLEGLLEAPTITSEGRIIDAPGWDKGTGLYLAPTEIPGYQRPTDFSRKSAEDAADYLSGLFKTFPFVSESDSAAMVCALLTGIVRRLLPTAPLVLITAPTPGTGKSKLSDAISIVLTGKAASVVALGKDDDETQKRLAGLLIAGDAVIVFDNVEGFLQGVLLCQITTQSKVRIRPLSTSEMVSLPTNLLLIANGNNLTILGDLQRRSMAIWLDARTERPELRHFEGDFIADIKAQRGKIISAALTIIGAYLKAGSPRIEKLSAFGSFDTWDLMCRRPLAWLGFPDPLASAEALRDQDPDIETIRALMSAWHAVFKDDEKRLSDVVKTGMARVGALQSDDLMYPELYESLQLACSEKPNSRRLGLFLRRFRGRIVEKMQFVKSGNDAHGKVAKWRLVEVAGYAGNCG